MRVLITGGCGFVGLNLATAFLERGYEVRLLDDLSRPGSERNHAWLEGLGNQRLSMTVGDVRDADSVRHAMEDCGVVAHLAAQVAVTSSVEEPRRDFEINALGTLNVLEVARVALPRPIVLFASTNKVYGRMEDAAISENRDRYEYAELPHGVSESQPLDFHSPYGCSKGAADQYVRDYARIFGLKSVVFRMSCLYGPHQFGNEDQGWVAHFALSARRREPVTIFGDGKQVRDVLYVSDAVRAYLLAIERIETVAGEVFNLGGGPQHTLSLLELLRHLEEIFETPVEHAFGDWRPGDQRVYVSNVRKAERLLGWAPSVGVEEGLQGLIRWAETGGIDDAAVPPADDVPRAKTSSGRNGSTAVS